MFDHGTVDNNSIFNWSISSKTKGRVLPPDEILGRLGPYEPGGVAGYARGHLNRAQRSASTFERRVCDPRQSVKLCGKSRRHCAQGCNRVRLHLKRHHHFRTLPQLMANARSDTLLESPPCITRRDSKDRALEQVNF